MDDLIQNKYNIQKSLACKYLNCHYLIFMKSIFHRAKNKRNKTKTDIFS